MKWIISYLIFFESHIVFSTHYFKPDFVPYCMTRDHCKPECSCEFSPNCTVLSLAETTKKTILASHNQIRQLQTLGEPTSAGMTMLHYDTDLEQISLCWAARCQNEYSECFVTPKFSETSQFVAQLPVTHDVENNTDALWSEILFFYVSKNNSISVETINDLPEVAEAQGLHNFVQLLGDQIRHIGCAWSQKESTYTFVCTYGPRGPVKGEAIYKIGSKCTKCPENYICDGERPFSNLCKEVIDNITILQSPPNPPPTPPHTPRLSSVTKLADPPKPPPRPPHVHSLALSTSPRIPYSSLLITQPICQAITESGLPPQVPPLPSHSRQTEAATLSSFSSLMTQNIPELIYTFHVSKPPPVPHYFHPTPPPLPRLPTQKLGIVTLPSRPCLLSPPAFTQFQLHSFSMPPPTLPRPIQKNQRQYFHSLTQPTPPPRVPPIGTGPP